MTNEAWCPHYAGFTRKMCPKCYAADRDDEAYERVAAQRGVSTKPSMGEFMDMIMQAGKKRRPS